MKLKDWLQKEGLTDAEFARKVRASRVAVGDWKNEVKIPGREMMPRIVSATRGEVDANSFYGLSMN